MPYKDKEKQRKYQRDWQKIRQNRHYYRAENRRAIRERVMRIKEANPCMDCGNFYPYVVMQFDHRDSVTKAATVSSLIWKNAAIERVLGEIAKCDLVCGNCHAIRGAVRMGKIKLVPAADWEPATCELKARYS